MGPALRAQPDRRLVDLVRDGYDAAFEEIVRRYRRPLDRFAAAIVGGRSEDVTQDAFSKALPVLRKSDAEIELRPWLYRIVRNTALNDLRDRAPAAEEISEAMPGTRSVAAEAEAREEMRDLMERLGALPEPQRAALVMRELEGLSHEEIAAALGVSGGGARQAIYRARAALREGFGLLLPLPALRALTEYGGDAGRAGGALAAGAGASSAAGGALKVGMATVLIAGTVGAGVAIEHHSSRRGPEAAEAAPLNRNLQRSGENAPSTGSSTATGPGQEGESRHDRSDSNGKAGRGDSNHVSLNRDTRSASSDGPGASGGSGPGGGSGKTRHSGSGGTTGSADSGGSGSGGSGSGDRRGGSSGDDGGKSGSGSGSDDGGSSGSSGISGGSSGSGDDGDSGSGDGGDVSEPTSEPAQRESSGDDGGSIESSADDGSDGGSSGSGSGELDSSGAGSPESDVSP